ncbi:hypothetical protein TNCV_3584011 [Trichonephila clavipes]|nr:hypothetical protein TNCV_3584011 [Trichonephila clavipes]
MRAYVEIGWHWDANCEIYDRHSQGLSPPCRVVTPPKGGSPHSWRNTGVQGSFAVRITNSLALCHGSCPRATEDPTSRRDRCTLNLTSSNPLWLDELIRRKECQLRCNPHRLTEAQNCEETLPTPDLDQKLFAAVLVSFLDVERHVMDLFSSKYIKNQVLVVYLDSHIELNSPLLIPPTIAMFIAALKHVCSIHRMKSRRDHKTTNFSNNKILQSRGGKIALLLIRLAWYEQDCESVLAASTARFLQFQRYAATICQFLIFRVFKSFSTSSIHLVGGLPLVRDPIGFLKGTCFVFRASPDVAEPSQSITSDDLREKGGDGKRVKREREELALDGEKGLVRDWSGKTMNAGGVENRIWTDCTGMAYGLNSITSVTNCLANKQCFYFVLGCNIFL